jgi:hypothetical protein
MKRLQRTPRLRNNQIFFRYLPYWKEFEIGHTIDIMNVTKGVFKSTIGLLLNITGKTKYGLNARKDFQVLGIRKELHSQERPNGKVYLPLASYTLTNEEKGAIYKCLCGSESPHDSQQI